MKRPPFLCVLAAILVIFQPYADGRPYLEKLDDPSQTEDTVGADSPSSLDIADVLRALEATPVEDQFPGDGSSTGSLLETMSPNGPGTRDDSPPGTIPGLTPAESVELVEQILQGNLQPVIDGPAMRSDYVPLIAKVSLLPPDSDVVDSPPVVLGSPETENPPENPINSMVPVPPAFLMPSVSMNAPPLEVSGIQQKRYDTLPSQDPIPPTQDGQFVPSLVIPRSSVKALATLPIEKPNGDFVPYELVGPQRSPEPIDDPENQLDPDKLVNQRSIVPIEEPADQLVPDSVRSAVLMEKPAEDTVRDEVDSPQRSTVLMNEPVEKIKDLDLDDFFGPQQSNDDPKDQFVTNVQGSTLPMEEPLKYPKTDELVSPQKSTASAVEPREYLASDDYLNPQRSTIPINGPSQDLVPDELVNAQRSTRPILEHLQDAAPLVFFSPQSSTVPIDSPVQDDLEDPQPAIVPIDNPSKEPVPELFAGPQRSNVPIDQPLQEPVPSMIAGPLRPTVPYFNPSVGPVCSYAAPPRSTEDIDEPVEETVPSMVAVPQRSTVPIDNPLEEPVPNIPADSQRPIVPIDKPLDDLVSDDPSDSLKPNTNPLSTDVPSKPEPTARNFPSQGNFFIPSQNIPHFLGNGFGPASINSPLAGAVPAEMPYVPENSEYPMQGGFPAVPQTMEYIPETVNMEAQGVPFVTPGNVPPMMGMPQMSPANMRPMQGGSSMPGNLQQFPPMYDNMPGNQASFVGGNVYPTSGGVMRPGVFVPANQNGAMNMPNFSGGMIGPYVPGSDVKIRPTANEMFTYQSPSYQGNSAYPGVLNRVASTSPRSPVVTTPKGNAETSTIDPRIHFPTDDWPPAPSDRKALQRQTNPAKTLKNVDEDLLTISDVLDSISDSRSAENSDESVSGIGDEFWQKMEAFMDYEEEGHGIVPRHLPVPATEGDTPVSVPPGDALGANNAAPPVFQSTLPKLDLHTMKIPSIADRFETYGVPVPQMPPSSPSRGLEEVQNVESRQSEVAPAEDRQAEVAPAEDRQAEVAPAEDRQAEVAPAEDRQAGVASPEDRQAEVAPAEDRQAEVAPAEDRQAGVAPAEDRQSEVVPTEGNETVNSDKSLSFSTTESDNVVDEALETENPPEEFTTTEWPVAKFVLTTETPGIEYLDTVLPEIQENDQISESELVQQSEDGPDNPAEAVTEENFREDSHSSQRFAREDVLPGRRRLLSRDVGGSDEVREVDNHPQKARNDIRFVKGIKEIFTTDEPMLAEDKPPLEYATNSTSLQDKKEVSERTGLESVEEDNGTPTVNKNHSVSKKDDPMNTLEYLTENAGNEDDASNQEIVIKNLPEDFHPLKDSKLAEVGKKTKKELQRVRRSTDVNDALLAALLEDAKDEDSTPEKPMTPSSAPVNPVLTSLPSSNIVKPTKLPVTVLQSTTKPVPSTQTPTTPTPSTHVSSTTSTSSTTLQSINPSTTFEPLPTPVPETSTTLPSLTSTPLPTNSTTPKKKKKKVWNIPFYPNNIVMSSNGDVHLEPKNKSAPLPPATTAKPFIRRITPEELEAARERLLKRFQSRRPAAVPNTSLLQRTQPQVSVTPSTPTSTQVKRQAVLPTAPQVSEDIQAYLTAPNPSQLPSLLYNSPEERDEARRRRLRNMVGLAGDVRSFLSDRAKHAMHTVGKVIGGDEPKKSKTS